MTVEVLPFATGVDANVEDQADYAVAAFLTNGFSAGIANSAQLNKVWRQSSFMAAALANWISQETGQDVLDDGNLAGLIAKLQAAVVVGAGIKPARVLTTSVATNILATDYAVMWNRTAAPAALTASLPAGTTGGAGVPVGQSFKIGDVGNNANGFPITVVPQAGQSLAQKAQYIIAVNNQIVEFRYVATNLWSIEL